MVAGRTAEGHRMRMNYAVAPVRIALDSISQMCDGGARILFEKSGGTIFNPDGTRTAFTREDNAYVRDIWMDVPEGQQLAPFTRQRETS